MFSYTKFNNDGKIKLENIAIIFLNSMYEFINLYNNQMIFL